MPTHCGQKQQLCFHASLGSFEFSPGQPSSATGIPSLFEEVGFFYVFIIWLDFATMDGAAVDRISKAV